MLAKLCRVSLVDCIWLSYLRCLWYDTVRFAGHSFSVSIMQWGAARRWVSFTKSLLRVTVHCAAGAIQSQVLLIGRLQIIVEWRLLTDVSSIDYIHMLTSYQVYADDRELDMPGASDASQSTRGFALHLTPRKTIATALLLSPMGDIFCSARIDWGRPCLSRTTSEFSYWSLPAPHR